MVSVTSQKAALLLRAGGTTAKQSSAHMSSEIVEKADGDIFSALFFLLQAVNGTGFQHAEQAILKMQAKRKHLFPL